MPHTSRVPDVNRFPRGDGSQPKISKTTPCKVAGSRRHGCALGKYLTRRANQRHSFIIAQSVKRTPGRAMAATAVNVKLMLPPRQSRGSPGYTSAMEYEGLNGSPPVRRASTALLRAQEIAPVRRGPVPNRYAAQASWYPGCRLKVQSRTTLKLSPASRRYRGA